MCALWNETEAKVRALIQAMPATHKDRLKETAALDFPDLVEALKAIKAKFHTETHIGEKNRLAGRYARIYTVLTRVVSLKQFGVPQELLQRQADLVLGKVPDSTSVTFEPANEVGHFEETPTQSVTSTR
jgi:hypothetical protein